MKIEDQVLSIEQIKELQELGFDVIKNSSAIVIIKENGTFIVDKEMVEKNIFGITNKIEDMFYSMTIGDIINILPVKIEEDYSVKIEEDYFLSVNLEYCAYSMVGGVDTIFFTREKELINNLFNTLVWCIKQKYIEI